MKKILFLMICIAVINIIPVNAMNSSDAEQLKQHNIVDSELLQKKYVTRGDVIESLCRLIGVNERMKETAEHSFYYSPYYRDTSELLNHRQYGYFLIASGYFCKGDSYYACADRNVTLKELSAFCTRILGDKSEALDDSLKKAIEFGIIKENDEFYRVERNITPSELCMVLNRMLQQKRYYYSEYDNVGSIDTKVSNMCIDEEKAYTYMEGFDIRKKVDEFFVKWYETNELENQIRKYTPYTEKDLRNSWVTFVWSAETLKEAIQTVYINAGDKIYIYDEGVVSILGEFVKMDDRDIFYRDINTGEDKNMSENLVGMIIILENNE